MLIILGLILILLLTGIVAVVHLKIDGSADCVVETIVTIVTGIMLVIALIFLPVYRACEYSNIKKFEETELTIQNARLNPDISEIELAALQQKVIEMNQWIAVAKYWSKNVWTNWFWPKGIDKLRPIK